MTVNKSQFKPDPFGDKLSNLLAVTFHIDNKTNHEYSLGNLIVASDHNQMYPPYALTSENFKERNRRVAAGATCDTTLTFGVGNRKHKYRLVLLDGGKAHILSEVPIN